MTQQDLTRLSRVFKALSNPNRLQIFLNLLNESQEGFPAGHTCFLASLLGNLNIGAPTVSHHIKELVNAGLITTERDGKQLLCRINSEALAEVQKLFTR